MRPELGRQRQRVLCSLCRVMTDERSHKKQKSAKDRFPVTLAKEYNPDKNDVFDGNWCVSKKLDGMRFRFDPVLGRLLSRTNKEISAPEHIREELSRIGLELDGEIFAGVGNFQKCISVARKKIPVEAEWRAHLTLQVFDLVDTSAPFTQRYTTLKETIPEDHEFIQIVPQTVIENRSYDLFAELDEAIANENEGLMLRNVTVPYEHKRSANLLKVKKFHDAEATVQAFVPGKGKHKGKMGAIECEDDEGVKFAVGSGFNDEQRATPPFKIGDRITFKYFEKTQGNKSKKTSSSYRFPTFLRVRDLEE